MAVSRLLRSRAFASMALVACLAVILVVLATLQYRWSDELSRAEKERMLSGLQASAAQFRLQLTDAMQNVARKFQREEFASNRKDWRECAEGWSSILSDSDGRLVSGVYVWLMDSGNEGLVRLNGGTKTFQASEWPASLVSWKERRKGRPSMQTDWRPGSWSIALEVPLLIHPLRGEPAAPDLPFAGSPPAVLLIPLNMEIFRSDLFPALVERCFGARDGLLYRIAIRTDGADGSILFCSDPILTKESFLNPDTRVALFGQWMTGRGGPQPFPQMQPGPRGMPPPDMRPALGEGRGPGSGEGRRGPEGRGDFPGGRGTGPLMIMGEGVNWLLVAKHRDGSLEEAVAGHRRRNLAVSFGILLLLGFSMGFVVASARRVQTLARMQVDFVTRVSHELRTPLAVICLAADNLADGVVESSGQQVRQYGDLIRKEGRKLSGMVEQIMRFATLRKGWNQYQLRECRVEDILENTLKQAQGMIDSAGFTVEKNIGENLPGVLVDAAVLSQCLQNLIDNALKYSGTSKWLALRAKAAGPRGEGVQISVADKGIGIAPEELKSVFDAFCRGKEADRNQIRGTGLGLFMVREAVVAMGGKVSVDSSPGQGTIFTIFLPGINDQQRIREQDARNGIG